MPYHEVKDPFQTAQDVLFEQLRKAGAEKQRQEREEQYQSMNDYLREQVNNYNNGVDPADNESGYGTEKTNREVQDSMNEKLADKGITVDNVDTKHVSDKTQDMTLANRPTTDDRVKDSMNEKLADKGITVDNVNTDPVKNAEHVTMDRSQSKTDTVGTGTATTSGQADKKLSVSTTPKPSDSPMGDMENMSKMNTSTSSTTPSTPTGETSVPKTETRTPRTETSVPKTETSTPKTEPSVPKTETSTPKTEPSVPKNETSTPKTEPSVPKTETTREKLADKDVNLVKNINPPKTEQKRFKDDSGYVTKVVPNEPSATIVKGSENKTTPAKTTLPKGGVQADPSGLVGLKNAKSLKK